MWEPMKNGKRSGPSCVDCEAQNGKGFKMPQEWERVTKIMKTVPIIITATAAETH